MKRTIYTLVVITNDEPNTPDIFLFKDEKVAKREKRKYIKLGFGDGNDESQDCTMFDDWATLEAHEVELD